MDRGTEHGANGIKLRLKASSQKFLLQHGAWLFHLREIVGAAVANARFNPGLAVRSGHQVWHRIAKSCVSKPAERVNKTDPLGRDTPALGSHRQSVFCSSGS